MNSIKLSILLLMAVAVLGLVSCNDDDVIVQELDPVPATPQGVYSITGDEAVYLYWNGIYETDVEWYLIYYSLDDGDYFLMDSVAADDNPNLDLLIYEYVDTDVTNGDTYFYAVAAKDYAGQVSELSAETVFDTPRPEGLGAMISNDVNPSLAGFNLATQTNVADDSPSADVWVDRYEGIFYLNAGNVNTDIQDMGYTYSFDDISWSPDIGWSELGYTELLVGHTYIVWTADNHFAKLRIMQITDVSGTINFQWGYQVDAGNPELAPKPELKPEHGPEYLRARDGIEVALTY